MAVIRLSGYPGAGKTTICKLLAEALSYEYSYAGGIFREMAKERGQSIEDFYRDLSQDPNLEHEIDDRSEYLMKTKDNLIVEGRIPPFLETPFDHINIFLKVAPAEGALRQSLRPENKGKSITEIKERTVERVENERAHYKRLYGIEDHFDETKFDIVVDTTDLSVGEAFNEVLDKVRERIQ